MSFPRYERYKDSGVDWLGEVPEHWQKQKLSQAFGLIGSGTTPKSDVLDFYEGGEIAWLNTGDLNDRELLSCEKRVTEKALREYSSLKTYPSGSVVIAMYGATIGKLAVLSFPTTVNQACCVFAQHRQITPWFLFYWFLGLREHIVSLAIGSGQPNISQDILGSLRVICPHPLEQARIVAFLDVETAKIDALIEEQRRLIELLKEKRQAVISRAVTKGLNPDAPMKDSVVEWMASIPVHWRVLSLGRITESACDGPFGSGLKSDHYVDAGIRVIRLQNIRDGVFDGTDAAFIDPVHYADLGDHDVISRDLLIAGLGDERNAVGRACVAPSKIEPAMVKADCFRFRLTHDALPEFVAAQLSIGAPTDAGRLATGSTRSRIPVSKMSSRPVAIPSVEEQSAIVSYLGRRDAEFAGLRSQAELGINLLQERRSALISAAVTGKIDVRNYTPKEAA